MTVLNAPPESEPPAACSRMPRTELSTAPVREPSALTALRTCRCVEQAPQFAADRVQRCGPDVKEGGVGVDGCLPRDTAIFLCLRGFESVWMHAVTRRCGYPADSSDLAAGAAGAATSGPRRRSDRGLRLTPGPVTGGDTDSPLWSQAAHSVG